ncbi:MAG: hypothetical protein R3E32_16085 [Chitinophagales bacterium]
MKNIFFLIACCCFLSSCATVMNSRWTNIAVYTTEPSTIIVHKDTIQTENNRATVKLTRGNESVEITAQTDSLSKTVTIRPQNSVAYWLNFFYTGYIGMVAEANSPKRFGYQQIVFLNSADTLPTFSKYRPLYRKGELFFQVSLPHINQFLLKPPTESTKSSLGFWGISAGLDYYHSQNQYFNLSVSAVDDFFVPIPAPVDGNGQYESMSSVSLSFSNNYKINRFSLGYGLSYAKNIWELKYSDGFEPLPTAMELDKIRSHNLGLVFSSYYQTGSHFNIGLIYRPTFIRLDKGEPSAYEHVVSVDFAWKIGLKN